MCTMSLPRSGHARQAAPRATIVLVHGTRFDHRQWRAYPELLPSDQVLAPDLPGHGRRLDERFTLDGAIGAVGAAVDSAPPSVPVVVAGHSLGGYVAAAYAQRRPDRLAGLALIGATAEPRGAGAHLYRTFARAAGRIGPERAVRFSNAVIGRHLSAADRAEILTGPEAYGVLSDAWEEVIGHCGAHLLDEVACPVLLLSGSLDQLGVHRRRFAAHCRAPSVVTVPRASHLLPITQPVATARILDDFVAAVTAAPDASVRPGTG